MSAQDVILTRMREARIPPYAYASSLALERQPELAKIVQGKEYVNAADGLVSYLLTAREYNETMNLKVTKTSAVFAKELVLHRRVVAYRSVFDLVRASERLSLEEAEADIPALGRGFIVVGDLGGMLDEFSELQWAGLQSLLLSHVSRGGALILGVTTATSWGLDMALLLTSFTHIRLV
jgi:hypothetical protein